MRLEKHHWYGTYSVEIALVIGCNLRGLPFALLDLCDHLDPDSIRDGVNDVGIEVTGRVDVGQKEGVSLCRAPHLTTHVGSPEAVATRLVFAQRQCVGDLCHRVLRVIVTCRQTKKFLYLSLYLEVVIESLVDEEFGPLEIHGKYTHTLFMKIFDRPGIQGLDWNKEKIWELGALAKWGKILPGSGLGISSMLFPS